MPQLTYPTSMTLALPGNWADLPISGAVESAVLEDDGSETPVAFGAFAAQGTADSQALPLAATTDLIRGFNLLSMAVAPEDRGADTDDGDGTVAVGAKLSLARSGRVYARCEDGCSPGDPLFVRAVATGVEVPGACRASADGTDTIDGTAFGVWRSTAAAGEIGVLEFDLANFKADPLD